MVMFTAKNGCKWQFEGFPIKVPIPLNFQQSPPQILINISFIRAYLTADHK